MDYLRSAFVGWLTGGLVGIIFVFASDVVMGPNGGDRYALISILSMIIGIAAGIISTAVSKANKAAERRAREELNRKEDQARQRRALEQRAKESRARKLRLEQSILESTRIAIVEFNSLPRALRDGVSHRNEAMKHFRAGAFSPFWSEVERGYASLGLYRSHLTTLAGLGKSHADAMRQCSAEYGSSAHLPPFPVSIEAANAARAGEDAERELASIVYEAQKEPVFAQIWEQRRTTAAVVKGFQNLEHAVAGMRSELSAGIADLEASIRLSSAQVGASLRQVESQSRSLADAQAQELSDLNYQMRDAVWYLKQNWKRDLIR